MRSCSAMLRIQFIGRVHAEGVQGTEEPLDAPGSNNVEAEGRTREFVCAGSAAFIRSDASPLSANTVWKASMAASAPRLW